MDKNSKLTDHKKCHIFLGKINVALHQLVLSLKVFYLKNMEVNEDVLLIEVFSDLMILTF